ncbi:Hypothetical protein R9X50_00373300 [Acrodontium crateriforme]|uniref:UBA domain-containing protein n=1 Tax=Acrodontium crateriforme TaxID=150365 RepID=A0AAQ3R7Q7_9PEZI|nr:Hypothetical protein R9X50_00373300 [Acrodontium crateriforme]
MSPPKTKKRKHNTEQQEATSSPTQPASSSGSSRFFGQQARRIRSHADTAHHPDNSLLASSARTNKQTTPPDKYSLRKIAAKAGSLSKMGAFFPNLSDIDPNPPPVPARPPMAQTAAVPEPDEEKVAMMCSLGVVDRVTAIRYLKAKRNDVDAAVNAFYDNEDISQLEQAAVQGPQNAAWDEAMFSADREGNQSLHPLGATAPPSRAPSRTGNRYPTSQQQEYADLQQALNMSRSQNLEDSQHFQQEAGIIGVDGNQTKYGPATRSDYDSGQWAMVPTASARQIGGFAASEIVPDVSIEAQKHVPGEPRVLKYVPNGDYLASLITVLHSIPAARESLLMRQNLLPDYGEDEEWWKGHSISLPTIVNLEDGRPVEEDSGQGNDDGLIAEVQRLMAFLDASDRSVASPAALAQTESMKNDTTIYTASKTVAELFLNKWMVAAMQALSTKEHNADDHSFSSVAWFSTAINCSGSDGAPHLEEVPVIDVKTPPIPEGHKIPLTELLDNLFWGADSTEMVENENYVTRPADVLIVHLHRGDAYETVSGGEPLRVEVPPEMYIDKYLAENSEIMSVVKTRRMQALERIQKLEIIEQRLKTWRLPRAQAAIDSTALLSDTKRRFTALSGSKSESGEYSQMINGDSSTHLVDDTKHLSSSVDIACEIERVIQSINTKLILLDEEKNKTRQALNEASIGAIPPSELKHRYTLRGIATKPNVTYFLRPKESQESQDNGSKGDDAEMLISLDSGEDATQANDPSSSDEDENTTPLGMQWWRVEYEVHTNGTNAFIQRAEMADYDVLRAPETEYGSALLIYASATAQQVQVDDALKLPPALERFVQRDNALFRASIDAAPPPAYGVGLWHVPNDSIRPQREIIGDGPEHIEMMGPINHSIERKSSFDSMHGEGGSDNGRDSPMQFNEDSSYFENSEESKYARPAYEDDAFMDHSQFGLPPTSTATAMVGMSFEEDEVKEIRLDGQEDTMDEQGDDQEMDNVEMVHKPLIPAEK